VKYARKDVREKSNHDKQDHEAAGDPEPGTDMGKLYHF
jgi:hypothetical protein